MCLNNYRCTQLGHCDIDMISFINKNVIDVLYIKNGAQFLNATSLSFLTFTFISPVTKIYGQE